VPTLEHEQDLWAAGFAQVAGVDEAGRGAWAGPVVAAAVVLPTGCADKLHGVTDSKKLSAKARATLRLVIEQTASAYAIGAAPQTEIDALGILAATRLAMRRAIEKLLVQPHALLIDAVKLPDVAIHQRVFNFADSISLSVAAASILAKTERDAMMQGLEEDWPGYGFGQHKGYGTKLHQAALQQLGVSAVHRRSFKPVQARWMIGA
jgi:ribonuclease HII